MNVTVFNKNTGFDEEKTLSKSDVGLGNVTNDAQVKGIASSTDNAIVRWDSTTGKLVQDSSVFIDDSGKLGIGTSAPWCALTVNSGLTQASFGGQNGAYMYLVNYTGNCSIGYNLLNKTAFLYGKGSSNNYAGLANYRTDLGEYRWYSTVSTGNDGDTATLASLLGLNYSGNLIPYAGGTLGTPSYYWGTAYLYHIKTNGELIKLNQGGSGNRYAYIDMHGDDTYTDYAIRIIRYNNGANSDSIIDHRGVSNFILSMYDAGGFYLKTSNSNRFSIDPSGYSYFYSLNTTSTTSGYGYIMQNTSTGEIRRYTSSERYKKNITDIETDTSQIYNLRPVTFEADEPAEKDEYGYDIQPIRKEIGLIAEEVNEIFPELVYFDKDNKPEGVHYNNLSILLLSEVKKINDRLKELEAKINGNKKAN